MSLKTKQILRYISITTTIIWMLVIFRFSMDSGSSSHELSSNFVDVFNHVITFLTHQDISSMPTEYFSLIEALIRKIAHMSIYFILSINIMCVLFTFNLKIRWKSLIALLFCFLYALSDEFHQLFVDGRGASFFDCLIDTFGALLGIIASLIVYCIFYTIMSKQKQNIN